MLIKTIMKLKHENLLEQLTFDGDLIIYKPEGLTFGRGVIELPINLVLDYQYRSFMGISRLKLYINRYSYGQKSPVVKPIRSLYLLRVTDKFRARLLRNLDQVIISNLKNQNIAFNHISGESMSCFYHERRKSRKNTRWTNMELSIDNNMEINKSEDFQLYTLYEEVMRMAS